MRDVTEASVWNIQMDSRTATRLPSYELTKTVVSVKKLCKPGLITWKPFDFLSKPEELNHGKDIGN